MFIVLFISICFLSSMVFLLYRTGGFSTLIPVLLVDVFGEVDIHIPFGIYMASSAISQLLGIPFIGEN